MGQCFVLNKDKSLPNYVCNCMNKGRSQQLTKRLQTQHGWEGDRDRNQTEEIAIDGGMFEIMMFSLSKY